MFDICIHTDSIGARRHLLVASHLICLRALRLLGRFAHRRGFQDASADHGLFLELYRLYEVKASAIW